jgi:hypothetical protein
LPSHRPNARAGRGRLTPARLLCGRTRACREEFSQRYDACLPCPHNVAEMDLPNAVRCELVPCSGWFGVILWLARGQCPLGYWPDGADGEGA